MIAADRRALLLERLAGKLVEFTEHSSLRHVGEETAIYECGLNSLSMFNFLLELEEAFGFRIPDQSFAISRFRNVGDILDVLTESGVSGRQE